MNGIINNVVESAARFSSKIGFKIKKASPEILVGAGIIFLIGGTVAACKATKKVNAILDDAKEQIDVINEQSEDVDPSVIRHDISVVRTKTGLKLLATYGPAVAFTVAGAALIFTSHGIMRKRNGALLASYNALDAMFRQYRQNVLSEEDGTDRDRRYLLGEDAKKLPEVIPNGDSEMVEEINKEGLYVAHARAPYGPYTFEFSKFTSKRWSSYSLNNLNLIRSAEDWGTRRLRLEGHLFLNDMLRYLDLDPVPWGQLVGWIRGSQEGDSYVVCITQETKSEMELDTDAWKNPIWLEFNCDGLIWDKL